MNNPDPIAQHPIAWLRPMPEGYKIPLWRWLLLPATALMLKRNRGVWVSGALKLMPDSVHFTQAQMMKSSRVPPQEWVIPLKDINDITMQKGIASETIEIHYTGGKLKLMSVRSDDFIAQIRQAIERS